MRIVWQALCALTLMAVAPGASAQGNGSASSPSSAADATATRKLELQVAGAVDLVTTKKRPQEGIAILDRVIGEYERLYADRATDYYCARHMPEQLFYLLQAASSGKRRAVVVSQGWSDAYFLKAYALVDLGQSEAARGAIEKAVALSPQNAAYLAELGHILQLQKDWRGSLSAFERAAAAAGEFSPPDLRNRELGRALRGQAYSLIELGRFDEAEQSLRKCLQIDANDATALRELAQLKATRANRR